MPNAVTVLIPAYNAAPYVADAIRSVFAQTVPCNVVVIDDGSTDRTYEVAWDVMQEAPAGTRAVLDQNAENRGAAHALNLGAFQFDSDFVAWLSADDMYEPDKIEMSLDALRVSNAHGVFTDWYCMDASGKKVIPSVSASPSSKQTLLVQLLVRNCINGSSVVLRRDVFRRIGYFDEALRVDVDGDFWLRMLASGLEWTYLPRPLTLYRVHAEQLSTNRDEMRRSKDLVRTRIIADTPANRLFPRTRSDKVGAAYRHLSRMLTRAGLPNAAKAAEMKGYDVDREGSSFDMYV